ncbi:hypothetical protein [Falsiroseomonas bella]|uniref:hypothetical protein n=1 Tax=Falsiroseomonas bella TaxID=2184016 RepID=UPI0011B6C597|nr:hypothetical protein [Falsiroseomonas bella]
MRNLASFHKEAKSRQPRLIPSGFTFKENRSGGSWYGITSEEIRSAMRSPAIRIVATLAATVTAAHFIGPVLAAGLGVPFVRLALNQPIPPFAGAIEAGLLASIVWWAFAA